MEWLAAVGIAVASNLDNLSVGIAFGVRSVRVPVSANVVIAGLTMLGTLVAVTAGGAVGGAIPARSAHLVAGAVLVAIGGWMLLGPGGGADPRDQETNGRWQRVSRWLDPALPGGATLSIRGAAGLGVALAANNVASGLPAGAAGLPDLGVSAAAGVASLICISVGLQLGGRIGVRVAHRYANAVAAALMLGLGALAVVGV